jgi:polyphosphate kinase 2
MAAPRAPKDPKKNKQRYRKTLRDLQIELVKFQRHLIAHDEKVLVLLEGRDAAGKDGTIKRIIQHLSPRETRVVALGVPSDRDRTSWYFERYVVHLPAAREFVLFNRSWYNRAGVEKVMGFCTPAEHEEFLETVPEFEQMLVRAGIRLFKYYLDISHHEQKARLARRRRDPLSQWKLSPIDDKALKHWDDYSAARDEMLTRTHTAGAPWTVVRSDDKKQARLNLIRDLLSRLAYEDKDEDKLLPDPEIVFQFHRGCVDNGQLSR